MGSGEFSVALPRGEGINHGDTEIAEGGRLTESRPLGKVEIDQPQVGPKGKIIERREKDCRRQPEA